MIIRNEILYMNPVFFVTCMVPLQISGQAEDNEEVIVWKNDKPSSSFYCRPIRFKYIKETSEVLVEEEKLVKEAIRQLRPTLLSNGASVIHEVNLTMIDGKVASSLSLVDNSMQCCPLCGAAPKQINDMEAVSKRSLSQEGIAYGLSTSHA